MNTQQPVRPMRYSTPALQERYFTLKQFKVGGQERLNEIIRLNKAEIKYREQQRIKKAKQEEKAEKELQQYLLQKERERLAKEKEKKEKRKLMNETRSNVVIDLSTTNKESNQLDIIRTNLTKLVGENFAYLQVSQNGNIVINEIINIKGGDSEAIFWNNMFHKLVSYTNGSIFDADWITGEPLSKNSNIRVVIMKADKIPSSKIQQMFRDGEAHCILNPLYNLWNNMAENSESPASAKRCFQIARRIKSLEEIYPDGVPENKMEEVAKICHRCIVIHDIIGNEISRYNKNSSKDFHFTNTRLNHVNKGYITFDKKYEKVSQEEMNQIIYEHDKNDEFFLITGDFKNDKVQSLRSAKGAWAVYNENYELFNDFNTSLGIKNYGIDAIKYNKLNEFVKEARLINSAPTPLCDTPNNIDDVNHIDIEKAYTQHKYAKFYKGFLGHIQMWRKLSFDTDVVEFLSNHTGIFQFQVISNTNELLSKLGIKYGNKYTLPSPEIEYFIHEMGLKVKLLAGCWGSTFDIDYTPEMLENRNYCMWAGKLGMDKNMDTYTIKGNREWASHLKSVLGDDNVLYFSEEQIIIIKIDKKSYYTTHHILAFITSYTRINMLEIMRNIKGELVKVILDGIYFRGEVPDVNIPHKNNKDIKKHIGFRDAWYFPSDINTNDWTNYNKDLDGSCVLAGAGGTGKSFSVLTDKGIINPLYVVPSHILGRKCRDAYGCNYTTINKLIGMECRSYKEVFSEPGVVFIDELTMIESSWIEQAIKMYPNTLFYIAGDIDNNRWFQVRNGHPGAFSKVWIPGNEWRYVYYTTDMRSKDEQLKQMKIDVRNEMKKVFTDGGQFDAIKINNYVKQTYKTVSFDDAVKMFQPGDYWIAGTHKTNDTLLSKGIVSGFINKNKELVQEEESGAIKRGSFTTHSFQGLTIDTERVFISLDFFEYAMFYTSISRVRNFNQLVIVN